MSFVFDFRLSQGGAVVHAPVNRTQALVHKIVLEKSVERCEHDGLVLGSHGRIGPIEPSQNSYTFELFSL